MTKFLKKIHSKRTIKNVNSRGMFSSFKINFDDPRVPYIVAGIYFVVILIISLTYHKIGDYGVETDFYEGMVYEAKEFLKGNLIIEGYKGPLYPIFLAVLGFIFKDFFTIGVVICVISASIFLFFTYKTIEKIFNAQIAFGVVLLILSNSIFIQYSYSAGTDLFFCAIAIISIYFLVKGEYLRSSYLFFAGMFASLAYLTRTNGLFLPAAALFSFVAFRFTSRHWKKILTHALIYIGGFLVLTIPWSIYKFIHKGDFFYDRNFTNTAWELYGKGKMSWDYFQAVESQKFNSMGDVFLRDPVYFIKEILIINFYENFVGDLEKLVSLPFAIFLVVGILALLKHKYYQLKVNQPLAEKNQAFFFMNILFAFIILLPAFYSERFSLFLISGYALIVVLFLSREKIVNIKIGGVQLSILIFLLIFGWSLFEGIKSNSNQISIGPEEVLLISKSVPDSLKSETNLVIARKPQIGYYLNMSYRKIPYVSTFDSLISWMKEKKADYFFVSSFEAQTLMSYTNNRIEQEKFYNLINPQIPKAELQPLTYTSYPPAVLYKVNIPSK